MNKHAKQAITGMLNCFPQTNQDYQVLLLTLERLLAGLSDQAIVRAADRYAGGDVPGQSKTFAPSGPEFVDEVRRCQEVLEIKARPRLPAPTYRSGSGGMPPFMVTRQRLLNENAYLPVLFEDVGYDQFRKLSSSKQIPIGAKWVAALGIIYGPPSVQRQQAAE
jgi:hypothetical protein